MRYTVALQEFDAIHFSRSGKPGDFARTASFCHPLAVEITTPRTPNGKSVCKITADGKEIVVTEGDWICRTDEGRIFTLPDAGFRDGVVQPVKEG